MGEKNEQNSRQKVYIGARELSTVEATRLLPNFKTIQDKFKEIRENIPQLKESEHTNKEYNNIISILGKRGAGKTSILYTVKQELKNDVILPIIKPDNITSNNHIIASVLGLLKDKITELEKDTEKNAAIQSEHFKSCICEESKPLEKMYVKMLEYYCYSNPEYKSLLLQNYSDFVDYTKRSGHVLNADYKFISSLHQLISAFLKAYKENKENKKNSDKRDNSTEEIAEPLLVIMIDDIDLRTQKVEQVVDVLLAYLSHPRVACIISADYETLFSSLTLSFLEKDNVLQAAYQRTNPRTNALWKQKEDLVHNTLKKIMPPAFRYEIASWDLAGRARYTFGEKDANGMMFMFGDLFKKFQILDNPFYFYSKAKIGKDETEQPAAEPLPPFFNLLDSTARGLVNVYYNLNYAVEQELSSDQTEQAYQRFVIVKNLIDTIINANPFILQNRTDVFSGTIIWGNKPENTSVQFSYMKELIEEISSEEAKDESNVSQRLKDKITLYFCLFNLGYLVIALLPAVAYNESDYSDSMSQAIQYLALYPFLRGDLQKSNSTYRSVDAKGKIITTADYCGSVCILNSDLKDASGYYSLSGFLLRFRYDFSFLLNQALTDGPLKERYIMAPSFYGEYDNEMFYAFYLAFTRYQENSNQTAGEMLDAFYDNDTLQQSLRYVRDIADYPDWYDYGSKRLDGFISAYGSVETRLKMTMSSNKALNNYPKISDLFLVTAIEKGGIKQRAAGQKSDKDEIISRCKMLLSDYPKPDKFTKITLKHLMAAVMRDILSLENAKDRNNSKAILRLEASIARKAENVKEALDQKICEIAIEMAGPESGGYQVTLHQDTEGELRALKTAKDGFITIFSKTKGILEKCHIEAGNTVPLQDYLFALDALHSLSTNYRVWYGRYEAEQAYKKLKKFTVFSDSALADIIPARLLPAYLDAYLLFVESSNSDFARLNEIINAKKELRSILDSAYKKSIDENIELNEAYEIDEEFEDTEDTSAQ